MPPLIERPEHTTGCHIIKLFSMIYHPILNSGTVRLCPMSLQEIFPPLIHGSYLISEFFEYIIWRKFLILSLDTMNNCRTVVLNGKKVLLIQFYNYYYVQHLNATEFICGITLSPSLKNVPFNILYCLFYCILTFTVNLFLWFPFQSQQLRDISSTRFTRKNSWFKVAFSCRISEIG
jgi:hypothetical protein